MTADTAALLLIIAGAIAQNLFLVGLAFTTRWRRSLAGWALFTECLGLVLLLDLTLLYKWLGDDYALRDVVRLTVFAIIAAAPWLWLASLVQDKRNQIAARRRG